ncbi:right-handed parallel beta-helix repeat-containing protein [Pseudarthrobacter oxydans]|uniref:right-handed parallel beta-helix repeat-containing protein n=1 Tax=Pseudarthrobacter oxydans TaxID=1671 RepID=UPI0038288AFC
MSGMVMPPSSSSTYKAVNHSARAAWGMIALVTVVTVGLGFYLSLAMAIYPQHDKGFAIVHRDPYTHAYDPIALAELGLPPDSSSENVLPANPEVRSVSVHSNLVVLTAAGIVMRTIPLAKPITNLQQLKDTLSDPAWIEEESSGRYILKAAVITYGGTELLVGSPHVSEVKMLDMPSVFIGTKGGSLVFDGVIVRAVDAASVNSEKYQPFIMATDNATMSMRNSLFNNLGWDWNASYGVSWVHGSTGEVSDTVFEKSFIGVYTSRADGLRFLDSTFRDNYLYGLDPHTYSKNLTIDGVTAEGNGAHGIIFSDHVTDSVIKNSVIYGNGENGIMMDEHSTNNVIEDNTVYSNTGDGLVTSLSPDNMFRSNNVYGNRVGIRVDERDARSTQVVGNTITGNNKAFENIDLPASNVVHNNGGQWNPRILMYVWTGVALCLLTFAATYLLTRNRHRKDRKPSLVLVS